MKTAIKNGKNNAKKILDLLYNTFQSNVGATVENKNLIDALSEIEQYKMNKELTNRDIIYLINFYINYSNIPELALGAISNLKKEYKTRFKEEHVVILLFNGETLYQMGKKLEAKELFQKILKKDSNFIPAKYYVAKIEGDQKRLDDLKKEYPEHWMLLD